MFWLVIFRNLQHGESSKRIELKSTLGFVLHYLSHFVQISPLENI